MYEDLKTTGTCHYYMMKDSYLRLSAFTPLRKNSPYTETISIGYDSAHFKIFSHIHSLINITCRILRFQQSGLTGFWESWYVPTSKRCTEINRRDKIPRLTIGHLSSAFVILFIGYVFSLLVFFFEKLKFRFRS